MPCLIGKNVAVIGASRGVGRRIVEATAEEGARVLAVSRQDEPLRQLAQEISGVETLALDAAAEEAPAAVFERLLPDILVIGAGALPPASPFHLLTWREFAVNWEADVKIAFCFCKAALARPLPAGSRIVLISSGAALAGSPNSGGYAGAKRTQLFLADYSQKESDRQGLGLRFTALAPRMMPDTELGRSAVAGYSRYLGMSESDFIRSMGVPTSAADVAEAVVSLVRSADEPSSKVFVVSGAGLEPVAA